MDNQVYNHIYVNHVRVGGCVCGWSFCMCVCVCMHTHGVKLFVHVFVYVVNWCAYINMQQLSKNIFHI